MSTRLLQCTHSPVRQHGKRIAAVARPSLYFDTPHGHLRRHAPAVAYDFTDTTEDGVLSATGNVLANDHDVDAGTVLRVGAPGAFQGTYGSLSLAADGGYVYAMNNDSAAVQSLGRNQHGTDLFNYTATDGITGVTSTLVVDIYGENDAPIVAVPLPDQSISANTAYQWQIPDGSFTDIDQGDTLSYSAALSDGSALPSWLMFDASTGAFSGRVPRDAAGYIDIQVTVTDGTGVILPAFSE